MQNRDAVDVRLAPTKCLLLDDVKAGTNSNMLENSSAHEIAPMRVLPEIATRVSRIIRMMDESVSARLQDAGKLWDIGYDDFKIEVDHCVERVEKGEC